MHAVHATVECSGCAVSLRQFLSGPRACLLVRLRYSSINSLVASDSSLDMETQDGDPLLIVSDSA